MNYFTVRRSFRMNEHDPSTDALNAIERVGVLAIKAQLRAIPLRRNTTALMNRWSVRFARNRVM